MADPAQALYFGPVLVHDLGWYAAVAAPPGWNPHLVTLSALSASCIFGGLALWAGQWLAPTARLSHALVVAGPLRDWDLKISFSFASGLPWVSGLCALAVGLCARIGELTWGQEPETVEVGPPVGVTPPAMQAGRFYLITSESHPGQWDEYYAVAQVGTSLSWVCRSTAQEEPHQWVCADVMLRIGAFALVPRIDLGRTPPAGIDADSVNWLCAPDNLGVKWTLPADPAVGNQLAEEGTAVAAVLAAELASGIERGPALVNVLPAYGMVAPRAVAVAGPAMPPAAPPAGALVPHVGVGGAAPPGAGAPAMYAGAGAGGIPPPLPPPAGAPPGAPAPDAAALGPDGTPVDLARAILELRGDMDRFVLADGAAGSSKDKKKKKSKKKKGSSTASSRKTSRSRSRSPRAAALRPARAARGRSPRRRRRTSTMRFGLRREPKLASSPARQSGTPSASNFGVERTCWRSRRNTQGRYAASSCLRSTRSCVPDPR